MKKLSRTDIHTGIRAKISTQGYGTKDSIEGVQVVKLANFAGEDGTFGELTRLTDTGRMEAFPDFQVLQINRSKLLPNAIKAWHLHFNQEDIWYVPPDDHMLLGLWDIRQDSDTKDMVMRIVLGAGTSKLIYIPRGVAHGVANISQTEGTILYFVNQQFDAKNPDEQRLPWDCCGAEFWTPERA